MSFGVVTGVGACGMGVLKGVHVPQWEGDFGGCVNRHFQDKRAKIQTIILSKLLHRFQPNFAYR